MEDETQNSSMEIESTPVQETHDEGTKPEVGSMPDDDPWGLNGKYTQMLSKKEDSSNLSVYFIEDESKFLDTVAIMRSSRRGCGTFPPVFNFDFWTRPSILILLLQPF